MPNFELVSNISPAGDQPAAIAELVKSLPLSRFQTLLGATGTGKTFTMANVIAQYGRPTLVLCHNKTLAAQLYGELKSFFPKNAVGYFTSYYDSFVPESYSPVKDQYTAKEASINPDLERLRLQATASLMERSDVIIVATVSAIYGLGDPLTYRAQMVHADRTVPLSRDRFLEDLVGAQYSRSEILKRGVFRVRGDTVDVWPAYEDQIIRLSFWGDTVESITRLDTVTQEEISKQDHAAIYPAKHFLTSRPTLAKALDSIRLELTTSLADFRRDSRLVEAQRLDERVRHDIEMLEATGTVGGIENYASHLSARAPGERGHCLIDYFPADFLAIVDESHITLGQFRGMYLGDRSRKQNLVDYGFRLPSALDNRPLKWEETQSLLTKAIFVSATPADQELTLSNGVVVEQVIRPTGLLDPEIDVRPVKQQMDDVLEEIRTTTARGERTLIMTLTQRSAEDVSEYLINLGLRARYIHAKVDAVERMEIIRGLRLGTFDVLVAIGLAREGTDLPEVSRILVLDADQEGFARSARSLTQMIGRVARNANGKAVLYADRVTGSMQQAINETARRRAIQEQHNTTHGLVPRTIVKTVEEITRITRVADARTQPLEDKPVLSSTETVLRQATLEAELETASASLDFERAARLRDELYDLRGQRPHTDTRRRRGSKGALPTKEKTHVASSPLGRT